MFLKIEFPSLQDNEWWEMFLRNWASRKNSQYFQHEIDPFWKPVFPKFDLTVYREIISTQAWSWFSIRSCWTASGPEWGLISAWSSASLDRNKSVAVSTGENNSAGIWRTGYSGKLSWHYLMVSYFRVHIGPEFQVVWSPLLGGSASN